MRRPELDTLRTGTVLLVVAYHTIYMYNGIIPAGTAGPLAPAQIQDTLLYLLYPWFMALLFLISGICARCSLEVRTPGTFFRERTRKLLVPSTLGVLLFYWIQGIVSMSLSDAFRYLPDHLPVPVLYGILCLSGIGVLWFLQLLWLFSAILALWKLLSSHFRSLAPRPVPVSLPGLLLLVLPVWGSGQILNTPVVIVYRFGLYGFLFALGYGLLWRREISELLSQWSLPLTVLSAALSLAYVVRYYGENYTAGMALKGPLASAFLWCTCLALLGLATRYGSRTGPILAWLNSRSWGIYLFHYLPISLCGLLLPRRTGLPPAAILLVTFLSGLTGSLLLFQMARSIPLLRFAVLGIPKGGTPYVQRQSRHSPSSSSHDAGGTGGESGSDPAGAVTVGIRGQRPGSGAQPDSRGDL